ncbi:MAG: circularly permuted type 2 ATP-grasp protein [Alphaproteobacteria bacterium]|nr:circularly permuted type 2 ATP-grasp protein [Alphaproteobacteria bacterium]MCB9931519.1 circularly permuted type 2 ATP-grasp protein [Alphaproteobacteria bacterium]
MPVDDASATVLGQYRPPNGAADELLDTTGAVRPAWQAFLDHFATLGPDEIAARARRGDQYLRDAGVFFRQQTGEAPAERAWPLSHVPVIINEREWQHLAEGLVQRAEVLEAVVADLYGENRLIRDGLLPASLIAANPAWLRPMVGIQPVSGHHLHFIAFEVGRGPNGDWWVLSDRAQAPAGVGIALENRLATSRVFPELFAQVNVYRLAGFFRAFREALQAHNTVPDGRVGILTSRLLNEDYLEHAYIARYLGLMLLEGEDLTVEDGKAMVRTVAGLTPVSAIWRRIPARLADPLDLDELSGMGTPGLLGALRAGHLHLANNLGSGVIEARALMAFLSRICQVWFDESLKLPNVATWWCGDPSARAYVQANAARMLISPALSPRMPFDPADDIAFGADIAGTLDERLKREGASLVGQEIASLSTTPAYIDGQLVPRPMSLRLYLCRTADGWKMMPGGYARIGRTQDVMATSMKRGGSVADVWVVSDGPVPADTMAPPATGRYPRPRIGTLPSRAADNLYWLGRYVERAENMVRVLRAQHTRFAETGDWKGPLHSSIADYLETLPLDPDKPMPAELLGTLNSAVLSASRVHDRFSIDGWTALRDIADTASDLAPDLVPGDDTARAMTQLLYKIAALSGLVHENMFRFIDWQFLTVGRSIERTVAMADVLSHFADPAAPDGALEVALELGDCTMTYHRRYSLGGQRDTVVDLMVFDTMNPRAILFQLEQLRGHVARLPGAEEFGLMSPLARALLKIHSDMAVRTPESVDSQVLADLVESLGEASDLLTTAYLS